ncbi:MAG: molybdenum cofactor guanylyltransferase [Melioribacteraceae bacterium]|nr:molybdenum cofactor guanylyltransferase [Melioribacteraceae bacterium]
MKQKYFQHNFNAFVLAGGKSKRLGINKSLMQIDGRSLIERTVALLQPFASEIFISANDPGTYHFLQREIIEDIFKGSGPLAGIHSCLSCTNKKYNIFIATDLPFVNSEFISFLIDNYDDESILIPSIGGKLHFLCGIYKKEIHGAAYELLTNASVKKNGKINVSVFDLFKKVKGKFIEVADQPFIKKELLLNLNTQDDLLAYEKILRKK